MPVLHQQLTQGGWQKLSFNAQMGNIGAEISRARTWQANGDQLSFSKAMERVLELINLTLAQNLTASRFKELGRFKEVVLGLSAGSENYKVPCKDLENFCLNFALLARS